MNTRKKNEHTAKTKNTIIKGIGVNDADYTIKKSVRFLDSPSGKIKRKVTWVCPFYSRWKNMIERCYDEAYHRKNPSYEGCSVCRDWLYFSNFKAWMEQQDWEGKYLDKDILVPGNKVYSPDTCVFVTQRINTFICERHNKTNKIPIGAYWSVKDKKYIARCQKLTGKMETLGYFDDPYDAHMAWLSAKIEYARILAEDIEDQRVAEAIIDRYEHYHRHFPYQKGEPR